MRRLCTLLLALTLVGCEYSEERLFNQTAAQLNTPTPTAANAPTRPADQFEAEVVGTDGLALRLKRSDGTEIEFWLAGARPPGEPFLARTELTLSDLIGQRVIAVPTGGESDRPQAEMYLIQKDRSGVVEPIGLILVRNGLARAQRPATDNRFEPAEANARKRGLGLWARQP